MVYFFCFADEVWCKEHEPGPWKEHEWHDYDIDGVLDGIGGICKLAHVVDHEPWKVDDCFAATIDEVYH